MVSKKSMNAQTPCLSRNRSWMIAGGSLSILVGIFAISAPVLFSYVLTELIGALCLVSGVIGFCQALFGTEAAHRILSSLSAMIRIAAGSALFFFTIAGMATLTLILAAVFLVEGVFCIFTSLRMRENKAWLWLFLNGLVAFALAAMVYSRWPLDSEWVIGSLYGIQSLFSGVTVLMLGLAPKPSV